MSKATVKPGQTLADIAIEHCGGLSAWSELASLNGLPMTALLNPGQVLALPNPSDKRTVAFFKNGRYSPAAGQIVPYGDGIGWWIIEQDFIVQ
jgi:LysM repeat protein